MRRKSARLRAWLGRAESPPEGHEAHLFALIGDSLEGLATGVDDDMSAVILCAPSPQLVEVAAITTGTEDPGFRPTSSVRWMGWAAPQEPPAGPHALSFPSGIVASRVRRGGGP